MQPDSAPRQQGLGSWLGAALGPQRKHYVCGSLAALTNVVATFPIHKVLFRQQLHGVRAGEAVRQLQREGLRTLYRGVLPPLVMKTTSIGLMFGLYEDLSRLLHRDAGEPGLLTRSAAAVMAGTAEAALVPFERYGVRELYRGLVPVLMRNGPSSAAFFGLRGPIKEQLPEARSWAGHLVNDFVSGALLGATLGTLYFPLNVVKARAQATAGGPFAPFLQVLATVWWERDGSVARLFRGAHVNYHRSLLSWGIINATYELLLRAMR
uniref:Solute carrier family 25 member 51b n=1 Tax=Denticeps clupeoides TaxID=299321 RepID=A0AAY4CA36_9TELE